MTYSEFQLLQMTLDASQNLPEPSIEFNRLPLTSTAFLPKTPTDFEFELFMKDFLVALFRVYLHQFHSILYKRYMSLPI